MDILSLLPIILMIFAVVTKLNRGAARTDQRAQRPYTPSSPWAHTLETSLQKWLSYEGPTPTPEIAEDQKDCQVEDASWMVNIPETEGTEGVEGTAGTEGTFKPTISSDVKTLNLEEVEKGFFSPDLAEKNLAEAVIWAEILGKPKARVHRPLSRIF